jgi:hypothetical protein
MTQEEKEKMKEKMCTKESDNLSHREHMPNSRREERVKRKRGHSSSLTSCKAVLNSLKNENLKAWNRENVSAQVRIDTCKDLDPISKFCESNTS